MNRRSFIAGGFGSACLIPLHSVASASSSGSNPVSAPALLDGGFELPPGSQNPWRPFQHAGIRAYDFSRDNEVKVEGAQSLRVSQREIQVFGAVRQTLFNVPPGSYSAGAMMRSRSIVGKGWRVSLVAMLENGTLVDAYSAPLRGDVDWTQRDVTLTISARAVTLEVVFELYADSGTGWADRASLKFSRLAS